MVRGSGANSCCTGSKFKVERGLEASKASSSCASAIMVKLASHLSPAACLDTPPEAKRQRRGSEGVQLCVAGCLAAVAMLQGITEEGERMLKFILEGKREFDESGSASVQTLSPDLLCAVEAVSRQAPEDLMRRREQIICAIEDCCNLPLL